MMKVKFGGRRDERAGGLEEFENIDKKEKKKKVRTPGGRLLKRKKIRFVCL